MRVKPPNILELNLTFPDYAVLLLAYFWSTDQSTSSLQYFRMKKMNGKLCMYFHEIPKIINMAIPYTLNDKYFFLWQCIVACTKHQTWIWEWMF